MKQISIVKTVLKLALVSAAGLLVACGGSSSDSGGSADASISGVIFAAPVNGADVSVVDASGNEVAGPKKTNADGQYTLTIPSGSLGQDLIVKSTGGTFTDEATGFNRTAGEMLAYVAANSISNGSSISVTPGSTIIANIVMDPNTNISLSEAEVAFDDAFGYTPDLSVTPANATDPATADAAEASKLAGLRAAAFSQLNMDLGLLVVEQFDLLAALATDLADGGLDGENAGSAVEIIVGEMLPIDIENRFVTAMLNFHNSGLMGDDHGTDYTGLANDQIGVIPFAEVALTTNGKYKIVYVPGEMEAMKGKTQFSLHITDTDTEQDVDGLNVTLMPMMYMAGHKHSSPDIDCTGVGLGTYNCTVYYLMESVMSMDMSMGYWEVMVMAEMGESAIFYPKVKMAMGDTPKVTFTAQGTGTDMIPGMTGDMSRMYHVFKDSLTGMGDSRSFTVFVAAMENMMSFPALDAGTVLNSETAYALEATPMTVEFSVDGNTWDAANNDGNGLWSSITAISGLVDGEAGEIHVRINVANELKTTNGLTPAVVDGFDNGYSTFFVTPGGM